MSAAARGSTAGRSPAPGGGGLELRERGSALRDPGSVVVEHDHPAEVGQRRATPAGRPAGRDVVEHRAVVEVPEACHRDEQGRSRLAQHVRQLLAAVEEADRDRGGAGAGDRVLADDELRIVGHLERDVLTGSYARRGQAARESQRPIPDLGVAVGGLVGDHIRAVRPARGATSSAWCSVQGTHPGCRASSAPRRSVSAASRPAGTVITSGPVLSRSPSSLRELENRDNPRQRTRSGSCGIPGARPSRA